jgi:hypothetical protein
VVPDMAAQVGGAFPPVVQWSPRMGCIARPPSDEDETPFAPLPSRLLRATDEMEEWNEDLRTLYVACTRPQDYLILSAALPPDYQPAGPWMVTLADRFDLTSGICTATDVPAECCPVVRVIDAEHPPTPSTAGTDRASRTVETVAPPSVPRLILQRGNDPVGVEVVRDWLALGETLFTGEDDVRKETPTERVLRAVLGRWDFINEDAWRELTIQLAEKHGLSRKDRFGVEEILLSWANSELRKDLAQARIVRHDIEYLIELAEDGESTPGVTGTIDCLWQDDKGRWNVLFWIIQYLPPFFREACFRSQEIRLVLASSALRAQTGNWPRSVALAFVRDGVVMERAASRLGHRSWLAEAKRVVKEISARVVRLDS